MSAKSSEEVVWMLKNGLGSEEIQLYIKENQKAYTPVFTDFMQEMLDKYDIKRVEISDRTGISRDYVYKVLNGSKKTTEKDYIVGICRAIGMNLPETQHALEINGMALLSRHDVREYILIESIMSDRSVYKTNDWLIKIGVPPLKASKDMESYEPVYDFDSEELIAPSVKRRFHELSREISAEHTGNAPFDYTYIGNILVEDSDHNKFHVQGFYGPFGTAFSTIEDSNYQKHQEYIKALETGTETDDEIWETLEEFDILDDAYNSEFLRYYMEIDHAVDGKIAEILNRLSDTANYTARFSFKFGDDGIVKYAEQYDAEAPEEHQYFQIIETGETVRYSASHESAFMHIEMGDLYSAYFGQREEPKYFFKANSEEELSQLPTRSSFILQGLRTALHEFMRSVWPEMAGTNQLASEEEKMETLAQHATWAYIHNDYETAINENTELLQMAEDLYRKGLKEKLNVVLVTLQKLACCYREINDFDGAADFNARALNYKTDLYKGIIDGEDDLTPAIEAYTHCLLMKAQAEQNKGNRGIVKEITYEMIQLLEPIVSEDSSFTLFSAYIKHAYCLDEDGQFDNSIKNYEKAERLVRKYHLVNGESKNNVMTFYNNYAWVLWNRFENEEAIIYYGKAIELAEDALEDGEPEAIHKPNLQHFAEGLKKLYQQTGKTKELERLRNRLEKYGIILK